jgi:hypothetical protein
VVILCLLLSLARPLDLKKVFQQIDVILVPRGAPACPVLQVCMLGRPLGHHGVVGRGPRVSPSTVDAGSRRVAGVGGADVRVGQVGATGTAVAAAAATGGRGSHHPGSVGRVVKLVLVHLSWYVVGHPMLSDLVVKVLLVAVTAASHPLFVVPAATAATRFLTLLAGDFDGRADVEKVGAVVVVKPIILGSHLLATIRVVYPHVGRSVDYGVVACGGSNYDGNDGRVDLAEMFDYVRLIFHTIFVVDLDNN